MDKKYICFKKLSFLLYLLSPKKPQDSLDKSVPLNENTPRRVSANPETEEFSVFDETHPGTGIYHGHARTWNQLSPKMRSALIKAGKATPKGKMK